MLAPAARLAQRVLVADHQRGLYLVAKIQQRVVRIAPQHESDAALPGVPGDVRNALRQKCEVPQICIRIVRHRREEDDDRLLQRIRGFHRDIERRIVQRALRALHPVHDAATALGRCARAANSDAQIGT